MNDSSNNDRGTRKALIIAITVMLVLLVAWHLLLPILGIAVAVGVGAWAVIVGSVVAFCVAVFLFFLFSGIGSFIVGIFAFVWMIFAITLFPFLFPILMPLLIIVLFIGYVRRRRD